MAAFSIRVESSDPAAGRIRIGNFEESFELDCSHWSCSDYRQSWSVELQRLLAGSRSVVVLWTARCPKLFEGDQWGWTCFLEDSDVFIQERLFVPGFHDADLDGDGNLIERPREVVSEDGGQISTWKTTVDAIESFLRQGP